MSVKAILLFSLAISIFVATADVSQSVWATDLSEQSSERAVEYRIKGYQAQKGGDVDMAITYYQKAVGLNPNYAAPYNDLGVVYEGKGWLDRAERSYLRAIEIDPNYANVYSNLALLHEGKGEIDSAIFYWEKRVEYGDPNSIWTQNAWQKLTQQLPPEEVGRLTVTLTQENYLRASSLFEKKDFNRALKRIDRALMFMPEDLGIINLKKKIEINIDRKNIAKKITAHYAQGMKYYHNENYIASGEEFKKILEFLPAEN